MDVAFRLGLGGVGLLLRSGAPSISSAVPVSAAALQRKIDLLMLHFGSQRSKQWFDEETFRGLARLRGMECRAPEHYAEAFFGRKLSMT